jgi:hypothetical protein
MIKREEKCVGKSEGRRHKERKDVNERVYNTKANLGVIGWGGAD